MWIVLWQSKKYTFYSENPHQAIRHMECTGAVGVGQEVYQSLQFLRCLYNNNEVLGLLEISL